MRTFELDGQKVNMEADHLRGIPCIKLLVDFGHGATIRTLKKVYRATSIDAAINKVNLATAEDAKKIITSLASELNFINSFDKICKKQ